MFEYISRKIRNKTVELPFTIPGESTKGKIYLRDKQIVESEIGFLLEFEQNSSDWVDLLQYPICPSVITSPWAWCWKKTDLLLLPLDRSPCPNGVRIVGWWCSIPFKEAKETLSSVPIWCIVLSCHVTVSLALLVFHLILPPLLLHNITIHLHHHRRRLHWYR